MSNTQTQIVKKPIPLRIIFILNVLKILISFTFFIVFTVKDISLGGIDRNIILYTSLAYVLTFAVMVFSILKKNILGLRIIPLVDIAISIPASAFIGIGVGVISLALSFHNKVKAYFLSR